MHLGPGIPFRSAHRRGGYGELDSDTVAEVRLHDGSRTKLIHLPTLFVPRSLGNTKSPGLQLV